MKKLLALLFVLVSMITLASCGKETLVVYTEAGFAPFEYVKDGKITRNSYIRVLRDGEVISNTQVEALKIQKDDKAEINYGYECGIKLKDATGVVVGDILEAYEKVEIKRG